MLAAGTSLDQVRQQMAQTGEAVGDVMFVYAEADGRVPTSTEMAAAVSALGAGTQTLAQLQSAVVATAEAQGIAQATFTALTGRAANTTDELPAFASAFADPNLADETYTLSGTPGMFQTGDAATLLVELPSDVTLNSGVTPTLTNASGQALPFANGVQLAAFLLGEAAKAGNADVTLTNDYTLIVNWLHQINQPLLQAGEMELQAARAANASGNTYLGALDTTAARVDFSIAATTQAGQTPSRLLVAAQQFIAAGNQAVSQQNWNLVALMNAGADICIQESRMPNLASLGPYSERVYQSNGATTVDVTVDPNSPDPFGNATYHSKDQGGGFLEALVGTILDIAAFVPGPQQPFVIAAAVSYNEALGVQSLANGDVLDGLIHFGEAFGLGQFGPGGDPTLGTQIFAVDAIVGGAAGIAQSAQSGSALGIIAGALEVAGGVAGGVLGFGDLTPDEQTTVSEVIKGLGVAAGIAGGVAAIQKGDIADGLLTSLGPLLSLMSQQLAASSPADQQTATNTFQQNAGVYAQNEYAGTVSDASPIPVSPPTSWDTSNPLVGSTISWADGGGNSGSGVISGVAPDGSMFQLSNGLLVGTGLVTAITSLPPTPSGQGTDILTKAWNFLAGTDPTQLQQQAEANAVLGVTLLHGLGQLFDQASAFSDAMIPLDPPVFQDTSAILKGLSLSFASIALKDLRIGGLAFEKQVLQALNLPKNTALLTATNGVRTIPDAVAHGLMVEVKSVAQLYNTKQLQALVNIAARDDKSLVLVIDPSFNVSISQPLIRAVTQQADGFILSYNQVTGQILQLAP